MASDGPRIPIPLRTSADRRRADRFVAAMPVTVDGQQGTTRDLSASGLSFHADRPYPPGTVVEVVIEYLLDGHQYPLRCQVEVVRSEANDQGYTIGARLLPQSRGQEVAVGGESATAARGVPYLRRVD
ncbi:MAG TPA: PilZ domain-containing protein [Ramlibacter sp.]